VVSGRTSWDLYVVLVAIAVTIVPVVVTLVLFAVLGMVRLGW
jgi:hypothetical protein